MNERIGRSRRVFVRVVRARSSWVERDAPLRKTHIESRCPNHHCRLGEENLLDPKIYDCGMNRPFLISIGTHSNFLSLSSDVPAAQVRVIQ